MILTVSKLSELAYWAYHELKFALQPEFGGVVSWACLYCVCSKLGIENKFIREYGEAGDWICVETGDNILLDVGEFIHWVHNNS